MSRQNPGRLVIGSCCLVSGASRQPGKSGRFRPRPGLLSGLVLGLVFLCSGSIALAAQTGGSTAPGEKSLDSLLAGMLKRMDTIIQSSGRNDAVSQTWTHIRKLMAGSRLLFSVGPSSGGDLVGRGAVFEEAEKGPSRVIISRDLMEISIRNDVLAMSMVLNALVFAEAWAQDPAGYLQSRTDVVQGYKYSMDALYVQCLFCRDYAGVFPGVEGGYTGFLAGGLRLDGLSTVALYVLQVDQVLVSAFLDLDSRLDGGMGADAWYTKVEGLFSDVDHNLALAASAGIPSTGGGKPLTLDEQKTVSYIAAVGALSLVRFSPGIINRQMEKHPALQAKEFETRRAKLAAYIENLGPRLQDLGKIARPWREEYLGRLLPK